MQAKMIAGHELTPGKTVKDHIHVEGTELHVRTSCSAVSSRDRLC